MMRTSIDPLFPPTAGNVPPPPSRRPAPPRRRRRWLGPLAVIVAGAAIAVWVLSTYDDPALRPPSRASQPAPSTPDPSTPTTATGSDTTVTSTDDQVGGAPAEPTDEEEDALGEDQGGLPEIEPLPQPELPDDADDTPVPLVPVGCVSVLEAGGSLLVTPDPLALEPGHSTGHLTITNCTDADVDWTAATKPTVALDTVASTIPAAASTLLGFTIDFDAYEPGAIAFKIKVSEPAHNTYVDVSAFRPTFGTDLVPADIGLSAGEEAGGCADQCITKALLQASAFSPNVSLDIETTVPARMKVFVSKQAPQVHPDGYPYFPGKAPIDTLLVRRRAWTASLSPLQAATKYFVIVKATDANGHSSYRSGQFTTVTPLHNPGDLQLDGPAPGCAADCITEALVHPSSSSATLELTSHTPARFAVWVSPDAIDVDGGVPILPFAPVAATGDHDTSWSTGLGDLAPATDYHIVVRATDANGHVAFAIGTFSTELVHVLITLHHIRVTYDGDPGINRGELSFRWGVDDTPVGWRNEQRISSDTTIGWPSSSQSFFVENADGFLPVVYVVGAERDKDGVVNDFCQDGEPLVHDLGRDEGCDLTWNVASSGLIAVGALDGLGRCDAFGLGELLADDACVSFETPSNGDNYARFFAVVSFTIIN